MKLFLGYAFALMFVTGFFSCSPSEPVDMRQYGTAKQQAEYLIEHFSIKNPKIKKSATNKEMILSLRDPYALLIRPEDQLLFESSFRSQHIGLGIQLERDENAEVVIGEVLAGSVSARAGVSPGDRILKINNTSTLGFGIGKLKRMLLGNEGKKIKLLIQHENNKRELTLVCSRVIIPTVELDIIDHLAHLKISKFTENTAKEVEQSIEHLIAAKVAGLILDLRGSPGGGIWSMMAVAKNFLHTADLVFSTEIGESRRDFVNDQDGKLADLKIVVLIDGSTASAAEILAATLRSHRRAKLIGSTSYGKGTMQETWVLADESRLRLTTGRWYTPDGRSIDHIGIEPDVFSEDALSTAIALLKQGEGNQR